MTEEELPAWSLPAEAVDRIVLPEEWPGEVNRDWAWGGATGAGTRVCVLDSGIEAGHPLVGEVQQAVAISIEGDEVIVDEQDTAGDLCGHGTACAGVIRSLAPECELASVRVLGAGYTGSGAVLLEGLHWAIEQGSFHPRTPEQQAPDFIQRFSSASQQHHHYQDGGCLA